MHLQPYKEKSFDLPTLDGISDEQIEVHLGLYSGYVTHVNTLIERLNDADAGSYEAQELKRRFAFEFDGMRSHEYYFGALEGGPSAFDEESDVGRALISQYGSWDGFWEEFKGVATTRGSGWTILHWDPEAEQFIISWIDEHHLGHLSSLPFVIALDMWEHAYMVDRNPSEKGDYIDAYVENLNWETVNEYFREAQTQ